MGGKKKSFTREFDRSTRPRLIFSWNLVQLKKLVSLELHQQKHDIRTTSTFVCMCLYLMNVIDFLVCKKNLSNVYETMKWILCFFLAISSLFFLIMSHQHFRIPLFVVQGFDFCVHFCATANCC